MRIEIEIPKEFEKHFKRDKFKDSLGRIMVDIKHSLESRYWLCAGRYDHETIEMLEKAFEDSKQAYDIDKVIEELALHSFELGTDTLPVHYVRLNDAIEIVKQGGVGKKVVEQMIIEQYEKPFVPKYANYDYVPVYDGNDRFIGWIRIYYELAKVVE